MFTTGHKEDDRRIISRVEELAKKHDWKVHDSRSRMPQDMLIPCR